MELSWSKLDFLGTLQQARAQHSHAILITIPAISVHLGKRLSPCFGDAIAESPRCFNEPCFLRPPGQPHIAARLRYLTMLHVHCTAC